MLYQIFLWGLEEVVKEGDTRDIQTTKTNLGIRTQAKKPIEMIIYIKMEARGAFEPVNHLNTGPAVS